MREFPLIVFCLVGLAAARRPGLSGRDSPRCLQIPMRNIIQSFIGTPPQPFDLQLSFLSDRLIVLDAQCGTARSGCARFCHDATLLLLYCNPHCQPIDRRTKTGHCALEINGHKYNGSQSASGQPQRLEWLQRIGGLRTQYGGIWTDRLHIYPLSNLGKKITEFEGLHFISASLFDKRLISQGHGLWGLAPGAHSFMAELTAKRKLKTLVTFVAHRSHKFIQNGVQEKLMTLGALDKANCGQFRWIRSASARTWILAIERIDFMGLAVNEKTTLLLDFGRKQSFIPPTLTARLLDAGIVQPVAHSLYRLCPNRTVPMIRLFTKDGEIRLNNAAIVTAIYGEGPRCLLAMAPNATSPYSREGVWLLGDSVLTQYCVALDYGSRMIGLAPRRLGSMFDR